MKDLIKTGLRLIAVFLLLAISVPAAAQEKVFIIKTQRFVKLNKISIYTNEMDFTFDDKERYADLTREGLRKFSFTPDDSDTLVYIKYRGNVPFCFRVPVTGKSDTFNIDHFKLCGYNHTDTLRTSTYVYTNDSTSGLSDVDVKIIRHRSLRKIKPPELLINGKSTSGRTEMYPTGSTTWSCTPGKIAHHMEWSGTEIIFVYNLKKE